MLCSGHTHCILCCKRQQRGISDSDHCYRALAKLLSIVMLNWAQECMHCKYFPFNPHNNLICNRCASPGPPVHIVTTLFNENAFELAYPIHTFVQESCEFQEEDIFDLLISKNPTLLAGYRL